MISQASFCQFWGGYDIRDFDKGGNDKGGYGRGGYESRDNGYDKGGYDKGECPTTSTAKEWKKIEIYMSDGTFHKGPNDAELDNTQGWNGSDDGKQGQTRLEQWVWPRISATSYERPCIWAMR